MLPTLTDTPLASRAWRLAHLYTILDADGVLVPFTPNLAQRHFYNHLWYCNHVLKARKLGFSTFIELLNLDDLLFAPNLTAGIVDKTIDDAKRKLAMMATAYQHLDNGDLHPATWRIGREIKRANPLVTKSKEELEWKNGAKAYCGVSLRGGTVQRLHISELGSIAIKAPQKAEEIVNGALNALTPGNRADIESTHEGGRLGTHYRLLQKAMKLDPRQLTKIDFKFHFFPWHQDPRYVLTEDIPLRPESVDYFARLARDHAIHLTLPQMRWYDRKHLEQGHGMKKEFPSTPGEAFEAISDHAIYGKQMADLRAAGRITGGWGCYRELPLYTFSDIGLSDYQSTWLIQPTDRFFLVLDWMEHQGLSAAGFADHLRHWEAKWQRPVTLHFLPHDAEKRSPNDAQSYTQALHQAGLTNTRTVPRTPDVWLGIGYVRDVLPHCHFQADFCDQPRIHNGEEHPSGVACLEGYQIDIATGRTLREMPLHNEFSHSADAIRTFGEAWRRGMINPDATPAHPPRATGGPTRRRR